MKPYQERVVAEKKELDEKIAKLKAFIAGDTFKTVHVYEQDRLHEQRQCMEEYSEILQNRIDHFLIDEPKSPG